MSKISTFLELLKAPFKILSQNGKLIAITTTLYLTLYSISIILYILSLNPYITDLLLKIMALASARPGTPEFAELLAAIREDIGIYLGIVAAYVVLFFLIALFAQTAIVIIASCYYTGYDLSLNKLVMQVSKTWFRPFVTSICVQLIALGYTSLLLLPFLVPLLVLYDHPRVLMVVLIIIFILFFTLNVYLSVVWSLGVVVSVVEDCCGFSALAKAKELVKGKRLYGFVLNIFVIVVMLVVVVIGSKLSPVMPFVVGVIQSVLIGVISVYQFMAYTGFYFHCKNDMTKSGGLEYSRIPTAHVLDEELP